MFSLVITLISIALVVVLTLATIYYGGTAFRQGASAAKAARLVNEGQQLLGAVDLFNSASHRWPVSLDELVSAQYLQGVPAGFPLEDAAGVQASSIGWTTPTSSQPTYQVTSAVPDEVCRAVNLKTIGADGILAQAYATAATQCYFSTTTSSNRVIVTRQGEALAQALPPADVAPPDASLPAATDTTTTGGWHLAPTNSTNPTSSASPATVTVDTSNLAFSVAAPAITDQRNVTVTNPGPDALALQPSLTGSLSFSLVGSPCATLAAGQSCPLLVAFTPGALTIPQTATLTVGGRTVSLSGAVAVTGNFIVLTPAYGGVAVSTASACPADGAVVAPTTIPLLLSDKYSWPQVEDFRNGGYAVTPGVSGGSGFDKPACVAADAGDQASFYLSSKSFYASVTGRLSPTAYSFPRGGWRGIADFYGYTNDYAEFLDQLQYSSPGSVQFVARGKTYTLSAYSASYQVADGIGNSAGYDQLLGSNGAGESTIQLVQGLPAGVKLTAGYVAFDNTAPPPPPATPKISNPQGFGIASGTGTLTVTDFDPSQYSVYQVLIFCSNSPYPLHAQGSVTGSTLTVNFAYANVDATACPVGTDQTLEVDFMGSEWTSPTVPVKFSP